MKRTHIDPAYSRFSTFLNSIQDIFPNQGCLIQKRRNEIKRFYAGEHSFIVKKYKCPNFPSQLRFLFTGICKAQKADKFARIFESAGVKTPRSVAFTTITRGGMLTDSYFVSEEAEGTVLDRDMLFSQPHGPEIVDALMTQLAHLHKSGVMPGDLNLSNIMLSYRQGKWTFEFIDINRSYLKRNPSKADCARNMFRLNHDRPTLTMLAKAYAAKRGWNQEEYAQMVLGNLNRFEAKKRLLKKLHLKK